MEVTMEKEVKLKTDEEKKAALEAALARVRPVVKANVEKDNSVMGRLSKIANATPEKEQENGKKKDKKPLSLDELAKKQADLDKKAKENGVEPISKKSKKDEKEDDKENSKYKDKKKDKEKEDPVAKKEKEMKEMFSKVKLPSGMEIRQEGPSWVLLSKDGKQRTDITDVMNTIDKFNRNVDEANEQNRMQNAAQSGVDKAVNVNKKDEGLKVNETNDKVKVVGEALPNVKDIDGKQVFPPEDLKKVAETAINFSDDLRVLEAMKREAKRLEEEAKERRKKNDRDSDERNAKDAQRMQQQMQKMQNSM